MSKSDADETIAPALAVNLARALRVAALHSLDNDAIPPVVAELSTSIARALELLGGAAMQVKGDAVFCNHVLVKPRGDAADACAYLRKLFPRVDLAEVAFDVAGDGAIRSFLAAFRAADAGGSSAPLQDAKIAGVRLRFQGAVGRLSVDAKVAALRAFAALVVVEEEVCAAFQHQLRPPLGRLRRALHGIAMLDPSVDALLLAFTRHEGARGELHWHLASVATTVLVVLRRLKLKRTDMMSACMGAALHDTARVFAIPPKRIAPATAHMLAAAVEGLDSLDIATTALEVGLAPHPSRAAAATIAAACAFDALAQQESPDRAMRIVLDGGAGVDKSAAILLASTIGVFPIGSLVKLSGGQLAVVLEVPRDPALYAQPIVKVVRAAGGRAVDYVVDLAAEEGKGLRIVEGAHEKAASSAHFLLA